MTDALQEWPDLRPILELVEHVCSEETVPRPEVSFREDPHAEWVLMTDGDKQWGVLCLPDPRWAGQYDPDFTTEGRYRLLILHELAHHISWFRYRREGHNPWMYAKLFLLCVTHEVDLEFAITNELRYKPRAAMRGWNMFKRWALA